MTRASGPPVGIEELARTSANVAATRARSKKVELLSACLRLVSPVELPIAVKFLSGELMQGKIGLGFSAVQKALVVAAETPATSTEVNGLSLTEVDRVFTDIAQVSGKGSVARRSHLLLGLLRKVSERGREFIGKLILGELRHGALEGIMVDAVARATATPRADVRRAVMVTGNLSRVAEAAKAHGADGLRGFAIQLFRPVQPMLAEPTDDIDSALERLGVAALEYKLDGVRVQVHKDADDVRIYTRKLNDVTARLPEVVDAVRPLPLNRIILDGEVLALRPNGRPHPFQTTMRRLGRKRDVGATRGSLPLSVLFFDCLLLEDRSLIDEAASERHAALVDCLPEGLGIPRLVTDDVTRARRFLESALDAGHEGLMAKSLEAVYSAGGRGKSWLKIKRAHTLDLVIVAAEWGSGRRRGWLSNLHVGARDAASGQFVMIGKTFKGLTDEMLVWQTQRLLSIEVSRDAQTVYVRPELVAEVAFNEVQQSPHYESGFALRFARVKRYREDKRADEADTIDAVAAAFARHRR